MKKINRMLAVIITATVLIAATCICASAASAGLSASASSASVGDTLTFTVSVSGVKGIKAIMFIPNGYTDSFELTGGEWSISGFIVDFSVSEGNGTIAFTQKTDVDGAIGTFTLKVKDGAKLGTATVGCDVMLQDENGNTTVSASTTVEIVCKHSFTKKDTTEAHLKSAASCTAKAVYYYSCEHCGANGTATFEYGEKLAHTFDKQNTDAKHLKSKATCTAKAVYYYSCVCGENGTETFETGDILGHDYGTKWSSDSKEHWHGCSRCGDKKDNAAHTPGAEPTEKTAQTCTICGYVIKPALGHKHSFGSDWQWNGTMHWHSCSGCSEHSDESRHTYDNACDTTCNVCGYERKVEHKYDEKWKTDESKHWHECSVCGAKKDEAAHTPGAEPTETSAQVCTECGYVIKKALGHTHKFASDWSSDEKNHWHECSCGEKADVSAHNPGDWIIDREASEGVEGAKHKECTECKRTVETEAIPALPVATTTTSAAATTVTTTTAAQTTTGKPAGRGCRLTVGTGATFAIVSILGMGLVLSKRKTK